MLGVFLPLMKQTSPAIVDIRSSPKANKASEGNSTKTQQLSTEGFSVLAGALQSQNEPQQ